MNEDSVFADVEAGKWYTDAVIWGSKYEIVTGFSDSGKIKDYAMDYFKWAVNVGLVNGVNVPEIRPTAGATREQFAAIMHRYDTNDKLDYELVYNAPVPLSTFTEEDYPLQDDADLFVSPDGNDSNPGTKDKTPDKHMLLSSTGLLASRQTITIRLPQKNPRHL